MSTAAERAEGDLGDVIRECHDQIITGHLRPAGEKLWTEVEKAVKALGDLDTANVDGLLRAPDRTRRAWLDLDAMAGRYDRIREALSRLNQHTNTQPEHDAAGDHAEFRAGLCTVAGSNWRGNPTSPAPKMPWPDDPRGRLVWFVRNGATPWWPLTEERDAAWLDAHREGYEQMQQQQQRHHLARQWASSFSG